MRGHVLIWGGEEHGPGQLLPPRKIGSAKPTALGCADSPGYTE